MTEDEKRIAQRAIAAVVCDAARREDKPLDATALATLAQDAAKAIKAGFVALDADRLALVGASTRGTPVEIDSRNCPRCGQYRATFSFQLLTEDRPRVVQQPCWREGCELASEHRAALEPQSGPSAASAS